MTLERRVKAVITGIDAQTGAELSEEISFESIGAHILIELRDWPDSDGVAPYIRVTMADLLAAVRAVEGQDDD